MTDKCVRTTNMSSLFKTKERSRELLFRRCRIAVCVHRMIPAVALAVGLVGSVSSQERGTGVGAIIGEPTAITVKHWVNSSQALQASIGWTLERRGGTQTSFSADFLWHEPVYLKEGGRLPLFYGIGVYTFGEAGIRGTFGALFVLKNVPMDIFVQIHPAVSLTPGTDFRMQAGLGVRWFFGK